MAANAEYYRRTVITRLGGLSQHDHKLLKTTVQEWLDGCIAANLAWESEHTQAGVREIAKDTAQEEKLRSQHSILACHGSGESLDGDGFDRQK